MAKTAGLLDEIVMKAGGVYLSELSALKQHAPLAQHICGALEAIDEGRYSLEEWQEAVRYMAPSIAQSVSSPALAKSMLYKYYK
ncbi:MAG: hypothetical protein RSF90_00805 [Pygmaiobacter sp.]